MPVAREIINPQLPVEAIADTIERHTVREALALLASRHAKQRQTA